LKQLLGCASSAQLSLLCKAFQELHVPLCLLLGLLLIRKAPPLLLLLLISSVLPLELLEELLLLEALLLELDV